MGVEVCQDFPTSAQVGLHASDATASPQRDPQDSRRTAGVLATLALAVTTVILGASVTHQASRAARANIATQTLDRTLEELEKTCSNEDDDDIDECWQTFDWKARLQNMVELSFMGNKMDGLTWDSCALVGSGGNMRDAHHGARIDSYPSIIRVNQLPHAKVLDDFGHKTHVVFTDDKYMDKGRVPLTRKEVPPVLCNGRSICVNASIVFRRHEGASAYADCPQDLINVWGPSHPFLGCSPGHVESLARRLKSVQGMPQPSMRGVSVPSTGFMAFMTFAPLCKKMDVFGFSSDAKHTADGDEELPKEQLEAEHNIMRMIAKKNFSTINADESWQDKEWRFWRWLRNHVGEITFVED